MYALRAPALVLIVLSSMGSLPVHAQNANAGAQVYRSNCSICHSIRPGQIVVGPTLFGVVGRHSGSMPGFDYSSANRQSGLVWDQATLDRYLTDPQKVVPGTYMTFPGLKDAEQRSDVIAFLRTLR